MNYEVLLLLNWHLVDGELITCNSCNYVCLIYKPMVYITTLTKARMMMMVLVQVQRCIALRMHTNFSVLASRIETSDLSLAIAWELAVVINVVVIVVMAT